METTIMGSIGFRNQVVRSVPKVWGTYYNGESNGKENGK